MAKMRFPKGKEPKVEDIAGLMGPLGIVAQAPTVMPAIKEAGRKLVERVRTLPTLSGYSPEMVSAITRLQSEYPRLTGFINNIFPSIDEAFKSFGTKPSFLDKVSKGIYFPERMGQRGDIALRNTKDVATTLGHEAAHAGQAVRRGTQRYWRAYEKALRDVGYSNNPFEVNAEAAGQRFGKAVSRRKPR